MIPSLSSIQTIISWEAVANWASVKFVRPRSTMLWWRVSQPGSLLKAHKIRAFTSRGTERPDSKVTTPSSYDQVSPVDCSKPSKIESIRFIQYLKAWIWTKVLGWAENKKVKTTKNFNSEKVLAGKRKFFFLFVDDELSVTPQGFHKFLVLRLHHKVHNRPRSHQGGANKFPKKKIWQGHELMEKSNVILQDIEYIQWNLWILPEKSKKKNGQKKEKTKFT